MAAPDNPWLADPDDVWYAGSDEWDPWTARPAIRVTGMLPVAGDGHLLCVETIEDWPWECLFHVSGFDARVRAGQPVGAMVFNREPPAGWDGVRPLQPRRELTFAGEVSVGRDRNDVPGLTPQQREKRRRGWAW